MSFEHLTMISINGLGGEPPGLHRAASTVLVKPAKGQAMTGDKVDKETMVFAHLSDLEMAGKVRMLMRNDLEHEAVCCGSRDRIMYLSQRVEDLEKRLFKALIDTRLDKAKVVLEEAMQFCQRIDCDGDPLNIHLAWKIRTVLAESV